MTAQKDISHIPVIDFSLYRTDPAQCAQLILDAAVNVGFFYLSNFGIERDAVQEMFSLVSLFFFSSLAYIDGSSRLTI